MLVATKGGHTRTPDGGWAHDGRPEHLRAACEASLKALGVEAIGLYQFHRPDPSVPYAESLGALEELRAEGKVRMVGISNADIAADPRGQEILGNAFVACRTSCRRASAAASRSCAMHEQGIAFLPWSPLGGMGERSGWVRARRLRRGGPGAGRLAAAGVPRLACWRSRRSASRSRASSRPESVLDSVARRRPAAQRRAGRAARRRLRLRPGRPRSPGRGRPAAPRARRSSSPSTAGPGPARPRP